MDKILMFILILSLFLCIFNYRPLGQNEYFVFKIDEFIEWYAENVDDVPRFFSDFKNDSRDWADIQEATIADVFMILTYPIRFLVWFLPLAFKFISKWVLYGVF